MRHWPASWTIVSGRVIVEDDVPSSQTPSGESRCAPRSRATTFASAVVTVGASYTIVPWLGCHVVLARLERNPRATAVLGGFACMASRNPRTIASGVSPGPGPGGEKYGA